MRRILLAMAFSVTLCAQAPVAPEPLTAWPYYKEIRSRGAGVSGFALDRDVLDKARPDAGDLRLYDTANREIPYVLRVLREINTQSVFTAHEFNRAVEGATATVSCDLGQQPSEHNEVAIDTTGNNFRRFVDVEGSNDGAQWATLAAQAIVFRFTAEGRTAEQRAVSYPASRYRYLRVHVARDPQVDRAAPEITGLAVRRAVRASGETVEFAGVLETRAADRVDGRPASVWRVDLGGRVPVAKLVLQIGEEHFSRPFVLDAVDGETAFLASGDLHPNEAIAFEENYVRHLKLTVIDDRNAPLPLLSVTAISAKRQVVFDAPAGLVRLYYGNPKALPPHYDLAARSLAGAADAVLGPQAANSNYRPEPKPLSERSPWLVYGVLALACGALAAILLNLAKASVRVA